MQQSQDAQIMCMCFLNIIWFCRTCWSFHPFSNYPLDAKIKEETCFWKSILCRSVFICIIRLRRWKKRFLESPFAREISIIKTPHLSTIHVYSLKGEDPLIFMMAAPYRVSTYQTLFSKRGALFLCISCVFSLSLSSFNISSLISCISSKNWPWIIIGVKNHTVSAYESLSSPQLIESKQLLFLVPSKDWEGKKHGRVWRGEKIRVIEVVGDGWGRTEWREGKRKRGPDSWGSETMMQEGKEELRIWEMCDGCCDGQGSRTKEEKEGLAVSTDCSNLAPWLDFSYLGTPAN